MSLNQDNFICFGLVDLCAACENVFRMYFQGAIITQMLHHESQQSMIQAVAEHCYVCSIVWADIQLDRKKTVAATFASGLTTCSIYENETQGLLRKLEVYPLEPEKHSRDVITRYPASKFRLLPYSGTLFDLPYVR